MTGERRDQVVLISGGASGLGRAIAERFLAEGARVAIFDRAVEKVERLVSEHRGSLIGHVGDVRSINDNRAAVDACVKAFGGLDCAIGNAGLWDYKRSLVSIDDDAIDAAFDEMFHTNVKAYLLLAKAALPALVRSRGSVILTLSNAAFYTDGGGPLYTSAKHAVVGLVKQLAFEFAPYVRVNGVAPGAIDTDLRGLSVLGMANMSLHALDLPTNVGSRVPVGRVPSPAEYAGAYLFFASRQDAFPATGCILNSDGGIGIRGLGEAVGGKGLAALFSEEAS